MLISTIVQLITGHEEATNVFEQIVYHRNCWYCNAYRSDICNLYNGNEATTKMEDIMKSVTHIYPIGMMFIIGGGGTFKQVLIDGGVGIQSLRCLKEQACRPFY